jgi:hypothetical protein
MVGMTPCRRTRAGVSGSPAGRCTGGKTDMRRGYVEITWSEMTTALLTLGILAFLGLM